MALIYRLLLFIVDRSNFAIVQIIVDALEPMQLAAGDEIIKQGDMVRIRMEKFKGGQLKG
jgi:hypothetical protein